MTNESLYPGVSERVKAVMTDGVIMIVLMFVFTYVFAAIGDVSGNTRMYAFLFVFVLYDPLFTSFFGGTIGHMANNLTVRSAKNTSKKIMLPFAFVRFVFKALLGWISLLTMSGNKKNQAIHDLIMDTVVVYKKEK